MNKTIVFASSNYHKVNEINLLLNPYGFKVLSLNELNLKIDAEESGSTFKDNALIKARDIASKTSYPVLADDSGLSINALDGFPGVYSARFMEKSNYSDKCDELNKMLNGNKDRSCSFFCALAYIDKKNNIEKTFIGETKGLLMEKYDETSTDKFGYDPCFYSLELKKIFGHSTSKEKNSVSHRYKAVKQFIEYITK